MTRRLALALGCALLGALAGASAMVLLYGLWPRLTVEMDHDRPGLLGGFYKGERVGDLTFAWTSERGDLPLPGLDRNVDWTATIRLRGARQDAATLPAVTILADDVPLVNRRTSNQFEDIVVEIPPKPGRARGLTLSIVSSNTFVPGPGDSRRLGVQVDRIALEPAARGVFPPRRSVLVAALGSAVFGAVFGLLGATATTAVGAATVLAVGEAAVLRVGLGPFAPWLRFIDSLAGGIGLALLVAAYAIERWRRERLRNTARFALMFTGSVLFLKLLVLLHPDKWLIDAVFHAHRLEAVMGGNYLFTSIAPGGYQFPYPVGLYVTALPLARLVTDHVLLLRLVAAGAEAISCLFLYWMVVRGSGDRLAAAVAMAILQLMPLGFGVLASANLTQVFGQAMAVIAMAMAVEVLVTRQHPLIAVSTAGLVTLWAFLSHTSTFATLTGMIGVAGLLLLAEGQRPARRSGVRLLAMLLVTVILAIALYYAHFMPTYRAEYTRITGQIAGTIPAPASPRLYQPGARSILTRVLMVPGMAASSYTWPFLLLASAGLFMGLRKRARDPFWLLVCGWLLACAGLLVLGVLTPVDFRHYYAAMPALAILAARAEVTLWRRGGYPRAAAAVLAGLGSASGINQWLGILGARLF
jgi:hypothetical protein